MNVSRMVNGQIDPKETLNQSQIFVTTAGYKNTFSYEKLIQFLCQMAARPDNTMILGGTWRVPMVEGLLAKDFVRQLKMDGTYNEASFEREYESKWSGDVESAFFNSDRFAKLRQLNLAEDKYNGRLNKKGYYVLGVDVGRFDCTTEIVVIKVTPAATGVPLKQIVNLYTVEAENFIAQARKIKRIFNQFKCRAAVVDGNGLGAGLIDLLVIDDTDSDTGEFLPGLGVINDEKDDKGHWRYKHLQTPDTIHDALYIMKANTPINTELYAYCKQQMTDGKLRFLINENLARDKLMAQAQGQKMSPVRRAEYIRPYMATTVLREQMLNLVEENEGANIILKQSSRKIRKDKFSALIYGLYYCKLQEDSRKKKKGLDVSKLMLFN